MKGYISVEYAHAQIKKFICSNIIVLAGNHDYRHTGYLVFKKFFPSSNQQIYEFDDAVIMTLGTARPDRDEGEVGYGQNLWKSCCSFSSSYVMFFCCYTICTSHDCSFICRNETTTKVL